jgi:hypothetical protein
MIDLAGTELGAEDRELLAHPLVGSVILFTRNYADPAQLQGLVEQIHALRSPRLLVAVDHEGGRVQRFRNGFTALPPLRLIGHQFDLDPTAGLDLARRHGWLMASELLACGLDFSFAPCVDLDYGLSEIIGDRAFHSRAAVVGDLAVAYVHGMRDAGMGAVAKHFPGHGAVVADSHLALPVDRREYSDLGEELTPYSPADRTTGCWASSSRISCFRAWTGHWRACRAAGSPVPCGANCASAARCSPTTCRWPAPPVSATSSCARPRHWRPGAMYCRCAIHAAACCSCSTACRFLPIRPRICARRGSAPTRTQTARCSWPPSTGVRAGTRSSAVRSRRRCDSPRNPERAYGCGWQRARS